MKAWGLHRQPPPSEPGVRCGALPPTHSAISWAPSKAPQEPFQWHRIHPAYPAPSSASKGLGREGRDLKLLGRLPSATPTPGLTWRGLWAWRQGLWAHLGEGRQLHPHLPRLGIPRIPEFVPFPRLVQMTATRNARIHSLHCRRL